MKKLFLSILTIGLFTVVSCGPSAEEQAKKEAQAKEEVDAMFAEIESAASTDTSKKTEIQLVEHACNELCKPNACHHKHGEKGHTCGDACKK